MIVIVDYGVGNLASVANMLKKAGAEAKISANPADILSAEKILLPGVGHFDYGMRQLNASGLRAALDSFALEYKRPVLGICLGAQMMGTRSAEGETPGLGWVEMECHQLPASAGVRVPHMGWNRIVAQKPSPLLNSMEEDARFYFVHSYYMHCTQPEDVLATATHGIPFTCAFSHGHLHGVQFHPEKSLRHGMALLRAFAQMEALC